MRNEILLQLSRLDNLAKKENIETYNSNFFHRSVNEILDTSSQPPQKLYECLKYCCLATKLRNSSNENLANNATTVVRNFKHAENGFEQQIIPSVKKFSKFYNADFQKKLPEEKDHEFEFIKLSNGMKLEEIRNVWRLLEYGDKIKNCVQHEDEARAYINDVVEIGSKKIFGLLGIDEQILGLFDIDAQSNEVTVFDVVDQDRENTDFGWRNRGIRRRIRRRNDRYHYQQVLFYDDLIEVLNKLGVSADDVPAFIEQGAFSRFRESVPYVDPVELSHGQELWMWKTKTELILAIDGAESSSGLMNWSRFVRHSGNEINYWRGCRGSSMNASELLEILITYPQAREKICD